MLPVILVAVGAYLIGDSVLGDKKSYADGGMMAKGGQLEVGDMVMVDDSGYVKVFSGFDTKEPAKIISKDKKKVFGKVKYFYGLQMADGRKPFNNAQESMLTKVSKDGGMMAHGGKTQGYDDKEDERLAMEHGKMSKKDLDSTHARRDDARFEERGKMADGGALDGYKDLSNVNSSKIEVSETMAYGNPDKLILKYDGKKIAQFYYNTRGFNQDFTLKNKDGKTAAFLGDKPKAKQISDFKKALKDGYTFIKSYDKYAKGGEVEDIAKAKKSLISKAKSKGIYENFGQKERRQLEDKYGYTSAVKDFDNWAMNFDLSQL